MTQATETTLYELIGGMPTIERIVHRFYQGVVTDEVLKPMYNPDYLADGSAEKRLTLFLAQYWGGPTIYSEARGHPRLRMRHAPYAITPTARERWLKHFRVGLDEVALAPELDAQFWGYVQHAAEFLVNTDEPA